VTQTVIYGWYDNELGSYTNMLGDRTVSIAKLMRTSAPVPAAVRRRGDGGLLPPPALAGNERVTGRWRDGNDSPEEKREVGACALCGGAPVIYRLRGMRRAALRQMRPL